MTGESLATRTTGLTARCGEGEESGCVLLDWLSTRSAVLGLSLHGPTGVFSTGDGEDSRKAAGLGFGCQFSSLTIEDGCSAACRISRRAVRCGQRRRV